MPTVPNDDTTNASMTYAALRHGGEPPWRARAQLGLRAKKAAELEGLFQKRKGRAGPDAMRPKFALHDEHVAAVAAAGGYPALGGDGR